MSSNRPGEEGVLVDPEKSSGNAPGGVHEIYHGYSAHVSEHWSIDPKV